MTTAAGHGKDSVKQRVRERDGLRCTECGKTNEEHLIQHGSRLQVHRVVQNGPYSLENCVTLCRICHARRPRFRKYLRKAGRTVVLSARVDGRYAEAVARLAGRDRVTQAKIVERAIALLAEQEGLGKLL